MNFIIGISSVILLIPFFVLVVYLMKLLPSEFSLAAVGVMIVGDGVIAYSWKSIATLVTDEPVGVGIAIAFLISTMFKAVYMLVKQKDLIS